MALWTSRPTSARHDLSDALSARTGAALRSASRRVDPGDRRGLRGRPLLAVLAGAAAGAAGTTALNAVTYVDMTVRARPGSSTPETVVEKLSEATDVPVPGEGEDRDNRVSGLGPLMGLVTGVGTGALLGLAYSAGWRPHLALGSFAAAVGALVGSNGPMVGLGVTDPRTWSVDSWVSDLVPHAAYGVVTAAVLRGLDRD